MSFTPKYTLTPKIASALASIEVSRHSIIDLPITTAMLASLRDTARIASTHHSTAIEGNKLSFAEVREVIQGGGHFPNRERDELEVRNYYQALDYVDLLAQDKNPIQEKHIQLLHGISFVGKEKPTDYRDGQNVIRAGKLIVYIPPKAEDVSKLMVDLVAWINESIRAQLPVPIVAGLAHYQFATIHPYFDGNGRTARLLVTLILHKYGYGLKGIYSLEEYYARDLESYYGALTVGKNEDYYEGERALADLTQFVEYFSAGMADSFLNIKNQAVKAQTKGDLDQSPVLRELSSQQKHVLKLFMSSKEVAAKDLANFFNISERQARYLCQKWVEEGFFEMSHSAPKLRKYKLNPKYEALILEFIKGY
jgi:Fic family protein